MTSASQLTAPPLTLPEPDAHLREGTFALIAYIEAQLFAFYGLTSPLRAGDFLLSNEALTAVASLASPGTASPGTEEANPFARQRASLWLVREDNDELFIGLYFHADLLAQVAAKPPLRSLWEGNLDAFCVFVEEVSHFHLVRERAAANRPLTHLELEWQGDVDKALIAAALLQQQGGSWQLPLLLQKIYGQVEFACHPQQQRYTEANFYAGKFWQQALAAGFGAHLSLYDPRFLTLLRANYQRPLAEKYPFTSAIKF